VVLVDSSIWIAALRQFGVLNVELPERKEAVTCLPVIQEVLQGIRFPKAFDIARDAFHQMKIVESPMSMEVVDEAIRIYRTARQNGYTIRSTADCLIAACAIRNSLPVLHKDRDFDVIARFTMLEARNVG